MEYYDFIGIGVGPYNLSLAVLTEDMDDINALFFDETDRLEWHPGMLIEGTDMQVPFLADLVTFADPTNRFSFLNYLHSHKRLHRFFFFHKLEVPRQEYNDYLQWAADKISSVHFGKKVVDVYEEDEHYVVIIHDIKTKVKMEYRTKHIVMATGNEPLVFDNMQGYSEDDILHTSQYLFKKEAITAADHITIVGSGQSAAEIFHDLLQERENKEFHLTWLTRSEGIFQLESAKLGQEFFSPDYIDYFHKLSLDKRKEALKILDPLRNGIDYKTLNEIYEMLYHYSIGAKNPRVMIQPLTEVNDLKMEGEHYILKCRQWQTDESFDYKTSKVILATGYKPNIPEWFMKRFKDKIVWEDDLLFAVGRYYDLQFKEERPNRFYAVTNLEHSHGTAATNLSLAIQRNMEIINHITEEKRFDTEGKHIFQRFNWDS
ncbi:SidA/IucD/PvdA family monooxygenase [Ralstonia pickettii]|nr:SidA/IucD/PvdA family monooxygenase [Ralstonia pickettii]